MHVCLGIAADVEGYLDCDALERNYQTVYKPLISFLYAHPKLMMSFSFSGKQLSFYAQKHPEAIQLLSELTGRHQVEVLGGGYYCPVFPLLFPVDRSGQIEKLTAELRETIGKRPRGISLFESIWDPSLITTLQSCGMEYVQLDSTLIPENKKSFLPLIANEQGKTIKIIPLYNEFIPIEDESVELWITRIEKAVEKQKKCLENCSPVISIEFTSEDFKKLIDKKFFEELLEKNTDDNKEIQFTIPQIYLKNASKFIPSYIPAGMSWSIAQWAQKPYERTENRSRFPVTIYDFLNSYTQSHRLYERMMFLSMLVSQAHGDKVRKFAAREKLWEAQNGVAYVCSPKGIPAAAKLRQNAYHALNEAERMIRECSKFTESITNYDYNGDGLNEYVCQMEKYNAVISLHAGAISELEILQAGGNYADNLCRMEQYDKVQDDYQRGFFVEHLFEKDEYDKYIKGLPSGTGIFSKVQFVERKFEGLRKEIQLEGRGDFSSMQQPVSLRKNYLVSSSGLSIQYILKNESPLSLKGIFVVESNFAQTDFDNQKQTQYSTELIDNGNRKVLDSNLSFNANKGISAIQITDSQDKTSFVFEPNEDSGFTCNSITFRRPDGGSKIPEASRTFSCALYWDVDLSAGMEMEKTINLSVIAARSNKTNKNKKD